MVNVRGPEAGYLCASNFKALGIQKFRSRKLHILYDINTYFLEKK